MLIYNHDMYLMVDFDLYKTDALKAELESFVDAVEHKKSPVVSGSDGTRALELALQIKEKLYEETTYAGEGCRI